MALTDPMVFEQVRDALEALLLANQSTLFRTIGEQKQSTDAEQVKGNLRTVQVFYSEGNYPKGKSSRQKLNHELTFQIQYTASSPAKADLTVLDDPSSTPTQKQTVLANSDEGSRLVNLSIDELRRIITKILMSPLNQDLGMTKYVISDLWLNNFRKSELIDHGNLLVLTAVETLTCMVDEVPPGETPIEPTDTIVDLTSHEYPLSGTVPEDDQPDVGIKIVP